MDDQRTASPWAVAVHVGVIVSVVAAAVAMALTAFGDVPQTALVIAVIVVGFAVSWVHTGRAVDPPPAQPAPVERRRVSRHVSVR